MVDADDKRKLEPIIDRSKDATPDNPRYRRRKIGTYVLVAVTAASLVFGVSNLFDSQQEAVAGQTAAKADATSNGDAANGLANEVLAGCAAGGRITKVLIAQGLCSTATATKVVVKKGKSGATGATGAQGIPGNTITGPPGPVGSPGATVTGPAGTNGTNGSDGQTIVGPPGPQGEKGDKGDPGDSATGAPGRDAYPFTFIFVVPGALGDTTYSCTVTDPSDPGTCTQQS